MRKMFISCVAITSLFTVSFAQAATICDVKTNLATARVKVIEMLALKDKAQQEELKKTVDEASTKVEESLDAMLNDTNTAEDVKAKLTEFKETWTVFKETREKDIIPAVYAGDIAKAKELASTVQADRMKTMNGLIQGVGGDDCKEEK